MESLSFLKTVSVSSSHILSLQVIQVLYNLLYSRLQEKGMGDNGVMGS